MSHLNIADIRQVIFVLVSYFLIDFIFNLVDLRTSTPRVPNFDSRTQPFRSHTQMGLNTDVALQHFSAKHSGLYLYVGRILRPIWNIRCIKQEMVNNKSQVSVC